MSSFLHKVQARVEMETQIGSYRARVEAKYKIMETIKQAAGKILKAALPALIMFSATTGFAKVKDPEGMGKKFQDIATSILDKAEIKTHVLQNEDDQPQVIIYTLKAVDKGTGYSTPETITIRFTEGQKTKNVGSTGSDKIRGLAEEFTEVLDSLNTPAKELAKRMQMHQKNNKDSTPQKGTQHQMAWHAE